MQTKRNSVFGHFSFNINIRNQSVSAEITDQKITRNHQLYAK